MSYKNAVGRPPLSTDKKKVSVGISLDADLHQRIMEYPRSHGSMSHLLNKMVRLGMDEFESADMALDLTGEFARRYPGA